MRYEVTLTSGKVFSIEAPQNASREQVLSIAQSQINKGNGSSAPVETTFKGNVKEFGKGLIPGAAGLIESAVTGTAALLPDEQEKAVRAKAKEYADKVREQFKPAPGYEGSLGRKFGEGVGSTAPFYATGLLGLAGKAAATTLALGAGAGEARKRAEEEGGEEKKDTATLLGTATGVLDVIPVFSFLKRLPTNVSLSFINRVTRAAKTGGVEAAQEAAQEIGQNLIAQGLYKPSQKLIDNVGEAAAGGASVGAFIQVLTDIALGRRAGRGSINQPTAEKETGPPEEQVAAPPAVEQVAAPPAAAPPDVNVAPPAVNVATPAVEQAAPVGSNEYVSQDVEKTREAIELKQQQLEPPRERANEVGFARAKEMAKYLRSRRIAEEYPNINVNELDNLINEGFSDKEIIAKIKKDLEESNTSVPQTFKVDNYLSAEKQTSPQTSVDEQKLLNRSKVIGAMYTLDNTGVYAIKKVLGVPNKTAVALREELIEDGTLKKTAKGAYVLDQKKEEYKAVVNAITGDSTATAVSGDGGKGVKLPVLKTITNGERAEAITGEGVAGPRGTTTGFNAREATELASLKAIEEQARQQAAVEEQARQQAAVEEQARQQAAVEEQARQQAAVSFRESKRPSKFKNRTPEEVRERALEQSELRRLYNLDERLGSRYNEEKESNELDENLPVRPYDATEALADELAREEDRRQADYRSFNTEFEPLRFSVKSNKMGATSMSKANVSSAIKNVTKGWRNSPNIVVVENLNELPTKLQSLAGVEDARGLYDDSSDGTVYVIADNIDNNSDIVSTVFHESLGHFGLRKLFGTKLDTIMSDIYETNPRMQALAKTWLANNSKTYSNLSQKERNALAVEEVFAEQSENGVFKEAGIRAAFNRVIALIRKTARELGLNFNFSNNDVKYIVAAAHDQVRNGTSKNRPTSVAAQIRLQNRKVIKQLTETLIPPKPTGENKVTATVAKKLLEFVPDDLLSTAQTAEVWFKELPSVAWLNKIINQRGASAMARRNHVADNVKKWYKLSKNYTPEQLTQFFSVANSTTLFQVDPLEKSSQDIVKKGIGAINPNDKEARNIFEITTNFNKLDPPLQNAYKELRAEYDNRYEEFKELMENSLGKDVVKKLFAKYDKNRLKVYLPLWRSGDYWLAYENKNSETVVEAYNSENDRDKGKKAAEKEGGSNFESFVKFSDAARSKKNPPTGFLGEIVAKLVELKAPEDMIDSVYQVYLNYLPDSSIRQQSASRASTVIDGVTRYGVYGFEPDVFQAYANVGTRMASQLNNLKYSLPLEEAITKIKAEAGGERIADERIRDVVDNLIKQVNEIRNPSPGNVVINNAGYWSYLWFIAGNTSSAVVNTTQIPAVVYPMLRGQYKNLSASKALEDAFSSYANGGRDSNGDWSFSKGTNVSAKYKKLYDEAVSRSVVGRSTSYDLTEMQKTSVKDYVGTKAKADYILGWVFQNSERMNREVTLIAAFDLATQSGMSEADAIEEAMRFTVEVHSSALAEAGPLLFQQGLGKAAFTFKRFAQAQLYLTAKLFNLAFNGEDKATREIARKQLVGVYGAAFLLSGVAGMPLYGAVEFLANLLMGDDDAPFDFNAYVKNAIGGIGYKGFFNALLGVDIASRTGFYGVLWREDPSRMAEVGPALYLLETAMGPISSIANNMWRSVDLFKKGEIERGIEALAPSFVRNILKTNRFRDEGVKNEKGVPIVTGKLSAYNLAAQAIGFTPSKVAEARAEAGVYYKFDKELNARKRILIYKYDKAIRSGDRKGMNEARAYITKYNRRNPSYAIDADTLFTSLYRNAETIGLARRGIVVNPNNMRDLENLVKGK